MNSKQNFFLKLLAAILICEAGLFVTSCSTARNLNELDSFSEPQEEQKKILRTIYSAGIKNAESLYKFFIAKCPDGNKAKAKKIAKLYITECQTEGINSDIAFVQMCLETNYLRYGNLVTKDKNNFCGLGAIDKNNPGLKFKSMKEGVRAHIQHLHAYGTTEDIPLKNELVDPRYKFVKPRGKATDIFGLTGTWAADKEYGAKLDRLLSELEEF